MPVDERSNEDPLFTPREVADMAHRMKCLVTQGNRNCICADYAAATGLPHPDCPRHGYVACPKGGK